MGEPGARLQSNSAGEEEIVVADGQPTWTTWREAVHVVLHPPYLKKTVRIALTVGAVLFLINHLDEVMRGEAKTATYVKGALTCVVPFVVSNWGLLVGSRRDATRR